MLTRRTVLAAPLALACGNKGREQVADGPKVPSDLAALDAALQRFEQVLIATKFPMHELRPGLPRAAIEAQVARLPFTFPEELYRLYAWHDGTAETSDPLFYDVQFMPLARALAELAPLAEHYGIRGVAAFGAFEGSTMVLPAEPWKTVTSDRITDGRFERPVISIFEGVHLYFCSLAHCIRTETAWREQGVASDPPQDTRAALQARDARRRAIWRQLNPGVTI